MIKKEDIIPFTIELHPEERYIEDNKMCQVSLDSWINYFGDKVKILRPGDKELDEILAEQEVSDYLKAYKTACYKMSQDCEQEQRSIESDFIKLKILSKNKNYLYFDSDIILLDGDKLVETINEVDKQNKVIVFFNFQLMWSGDTKKSKELFDFFNENYYRDAVKKILNEDAYIFFCIDIQIIEKTLTNTEKFIYNYPNKTEFLYHLHSIFYGNFKNIKGTCLITDDINFKNLCKYKNLKYVIYLDYKNKNINVQEFKSRTIEEVCMAIIPKKYHKKIIEYFKEEIRNEFAKGTEIIVDIKEEYKS